MVITKLRQAEGRLGRGSTLCLCGDIVEHLRDTSQLMDAMVESGPKFAMKSSSIAVQMVLQQRPSAYRGEDLLVHAQKAEPF
jgi:hypothetical protein